MIHQEQHESVNIHGKALCFKWKRVILNRSIRHEHLCTSKNQIVLHTPLHCQKCNHLPQVSGKRKQIRMSFESLPSANDNATGKVVQSSTNITLTLFILREEEVAEIRESGIARADDQVFGNCRVSCHIYAPRK